MILEHFANLYFIGVDFLDFSQFCSVDQFSVIYNSLTMIGYRIFFLFFFKSFSIFLSFFVYVKKTCFTFLSFFVTFCIFLFFCYFLTFSNFFITFFGFYSYFMT
jgi:hypothetical protein